MPHTPVSQAQSAEPYDPGGGYGSQVSPGSQSSTALPLSKCLNILTASGGGSVSAEVALDLVLNDILKRACSATGGTAGAIALVDKGEMFCRATTGENAPDLGVRLDTTHGLSGACVTTRNWQRCNDTESDPRVNPAVCRHLGVRSILVVPVLSADELLGIMEIFSVRADAFSETDVRLLQAFSKEVVENMHRAFMAQAPVPPPAPIETTPLADSHESATLKPGMSTMEPVDAIKQAEPQNDYSTTALLVCVILLALIVGWMAGRSEWPHNRAKPVPETQPAAKTAADTTPSESVPIQPTEQPTIQQLAPSTAQPHGSGVRKDVADDLVVTHDGKVVFRAPPQHGDNLATTAVQSGASHGASGGLRLAPEVAQQYLVTRVEPEYPEQARKDQIQGTIVLDAQVGKDGAIQKLSPISGSPELMQAAKDAVQQWRFRPYSQNGLPQEFTTRVTVIFRLP